MKQLSLFNDHGRHNMTDGSKISPPTKRKYPVSHWSYRQRLIHRVSSSNDLSWRKMDWIAQHYQFIKHLLSLYAEKQIPKPMKHVHRFISTVNQNQLGKAVHAMYQRRHGDYRLSINQICKHFKISKPSLYRGFHKKYKK